VAFTFGKYKCPHTGHGSADVQYTIDGTVLSSIVKEKDLGLTISADMKISQPCGIATSNGNPMLDSVCKILLKSLHQML